jgi:hypothetical protein
MPDNPRPLYCLVAAPSRFPLEPYLQILRENGATPLSGTRAALGAPSVADAIKADLRQTDFFLGIIRSSSPAANVLVELGFALALGSPCIVEADLEAELPLVTKDAVVIRSVPGHIEGFKVAVQQVTSMVRAEKRLPFVHPPRDVSPPVDVSEQPFPLSAWESEQSTLVHLNELLKEQEGLRVKQSKQIQDRTADLAVWSDDLSSVTGNPVLIDVKVPPSARRTLLRQVEQFAAAIRLSTAPLGVLVLTRSPNYLSEVLGEVPDEVLVVPAQDFARNVQALGFGPFIVHLQNTRYLFEDG